MGRDHAGFGSPFALARRARRRGPKWNSEATDLRSADRATWDLIDKQWTPRCSATLTYFLGRLYAHECSVEQHVIAPRQAGCNRISPLDVPGSGRYTDLNPPIFHSGRPVEEALRIRWIGPRFSFSFETVLSERALKPHLAGSRGRRPGLTKTSCTACFHFAE